MWAASASPAPAASPKSTTISSRGRYSPKWPDGKKHARNVYAHTREECEEKLKVLIVEMKAEIAEAKRQKAEGTLTPQAVEKSKKKGKKKGRKEESKADKEKE